MRGHTAGSIGAPGDGFVSVSDPALPRRRLGSTSLEVTTLGLGGAAFGNLYRPLTDEDAQATVEAALAGGIAYLDTAPYYGYGLSEERIGAALARLAPHSLTLSSKVGRLLIPREGAPRHDQGFIDARSRDPIFDYTYEGVMRSWEESRRRLGRDRVDVLYIHDVGGATHGVDRHPAVFETAMNGAYRALEALRRNGEIGAIGLGVNECEVCVEAMERADFDCFLLAGRYTLLEQGALDSLLPRCRKRGVSIVVGGPFNSGALVEAPDGGAVHYNYVPAEPRVRARVAALRRVCEAHGVELAAAALQFPLHHECVASVIPGARSPSETRAHQAWLRTPIPNALWSDLVAEGLLDARAPRPDAPASGTKP